MALFKTRKNGPAQVEAAFGMFTKAINDLEVAVSVCNEEEASLKASAALALAEAELRKVSSRKARNAVTNLKNLIGG